MNETTNNAEGGNCRIVKIFISSTFREMTRERDDIQQIVFSKIRFWAKKIGVLVIPIDLRWGISEEDIESGKLADQCETAVLSCYPYFLTILGNTYGTDNPKVLGVIGKNYRGKSVTDFEITKGVIEVDNQRALIYDISYSKYKEKFRKKLKLKRLKNKLKADYQVVSVNNRQKLLTLMVNDIKSMINKDYVNNHYHRNVDKDDYLSVSCFYSQYYDSFFDENYFAGYGNEFGKMNVIVADEKDTARIFAYNHAFCHDGESIIVIHDCAISSYAKTKEGVLLHIAESLSKARGKNFFPSGDMESDVVSQLAEIEKPVRIYILSPETYERKYADDIVRFLTSLVNDNVSLYVTYYEGIDFFDGKVKKVSVRGLSAGEVKDFAYCFMREYKKDNNEHFTDNVVERFALTKCTDLSFMQLVVNELVLRGCPSDQVVNVIDEYVQKNGLPDLLASIIERLTNIMEDKGNAVRAMISLIAASDEYINEEDIFEILSEDGFEHDCIDECLTMSGELLIVSEYRYLFRYDAIGKACRALGLNDKYYAEKYVGHMERKNCDRHVINELLHHYSTEKSLKYFKSPSVLRVAAKECPEKFYDTVRQCPNRREYLVNLFEELTDCGDFSEAGFVAETALYLGEYEIAKKGFEKLAEKVADKNRPHWKIRLAYLLRETGEYEDAMRLLKSIRTDDISTDDKIQIYDYLSYCYGKTGDKVDSRRNAEAAMMLREDNFEKYERDMPVSLNSLAYGYYVEGNYEKAKNLYRKACEIRIKYHGARHPRVANNLNNIALCLFRQGNRDEAEKLFEKAYDILVRTLGKAHGFSLITELNVLTCRVYKKNNCDRENLHKRICLINEYMANVHIGKDYIINAKVVKGISLLNGGLKDEAAECFYEAAEYYKNSIGEDTYEYKTVKKLLSEAGGDCV